MFRLCGRVDHNHLCALQHLLTSARLVLACMEEPALIRETVSNAVAANLKERRTVAIAVKKVLLQEFCCEHVVTVVVDQSSFSP